MLHAPCSMRRGNKRKFNRETDQRKALYKGLATALIDHGKIKTTQAKAKSLSTFVDKLVSKAAKEDATASKRFILRYIGEKAANKLVSEVGPKFKDRKGGYTRVIKLGQRRSDGSPMALIEFTS